MRSILALSILFIVSCSHQVPVPNYSGETEENPLHLWQSIVEEFVNDKGYVDFQGLNKNSSNLKEYIGYIAKVSPHTHPRLFATRESKLEYYINAYNALSMYNVLLFDLPEDLFGFRKVSFFILTKFIVGGEEISLYDLENDFIRKLGEPRVHFALNCMSESCPRLPRKVFRKEIIFDQLERETVQFFSEGRNVIISHSEKKVYLSEILDFYTEDFLVKSKNLIHYANNYRTSKIPNNYQTKFIDYDWTIINSKK